MIFKSLFGTPSEPVKDPRVDELVSQVEQLSEHAQVLAARLAEVEEGETLRRIHFTALEADVTDLLDKLSRQLSKFRMRDRRAQKAGTSTPDDDQGELDMNQADPSQRKQELRRRAAQLGR